MRGDFEEEEDFRRLNNVTVLDTYPLPNMDFSAGVTWCKFFSKMDLRKGYFQIFMHPDDIPKAASSLLWSFQISASSIWPEECWKCLPAVMDQVLAGLPFVFVYLDDIIVVSKSLEQHKKDVWRKFSAASSLLACHQWREVRICGAGSPVSWPSCHRGGDSATSGQGGCSARPSQAFYGEAGIPWGGSFLPPFCASGCQNSAATHGLPEGWLEGHFGCGVDSGDGEGICWSQSCPV
jgi:hypothetical protein